MITSPLLKRSNVCNSLYSTYLIYIISQYRVLFILRNGIFVYFSIGICRLTIFWWRKSCRLVQFLRTFWYDFTLQLPLFECPIMLYHIKYLPPFYSTHFRLAKTTTQLLSFLLHTHHAFFEETFDTIFREMFGIICRYSLDCIFSQMQTWRRQSKSRRHHEQDWADDNSSVSSDGSSASKRQNKSKPQGCSNAKQRVESKNMWKK